MVIIVAAIYGITTENIGVVYRQVAVRIIVELPLCSLLVRARLGRETRLVKPLI